MAKERASSQIMVGKRQCTPLILSGCFWQEGVTRVCTFGRTSGRVSALTVGDYQ